MQSHPRVLLLQPDAVLRGLLRELLAEEGFDVTPCASLPEVWASLGVGAGVVALVDVSGAEPWHPQDEGRQALESLGRAVPLIALVDGPQTETAAQLGVAAVLPKPFDLDNLLAAVRQVLSDPRSSR